MKKKEWRKLEKLLEEDIKLQLLEEWKKLRKFLFP